MEGPAKLQFSQPAPGVLELRHLPSLDGFRGLSIIMVVVSHSFGDQRPWFTGGFGVSIFFVISGFLITLLLLKEKFVTGKVSLTRFYIRRVLRIFPVAYLYLAVLLLLNRIFTLEISNAAFLSAALYLQNTTIFVDGAEYVSHYWSLSSEEQFYIIFPFFLKKGTMLYAAVVFLFLILVPVVNTADFHHWITSGLLHHVNEILRFMTTMLIGSLFAVMFFFGIITPGFLKINRLFASLILLIGAAALHVNNNLFPSSTIAQLLSNIMVASLIVLNVKSDDNFFYRLLNARWLTYIGVLSYSIYIWQEIFTKSIPWKNSFSGGGSPWFNWPLLLLVSYCSYHFYEKKFLKLKDRFKTVS